MQRLIGRKRIDQLDAYAYTPEENSVKTEGCGVPERAIYEHALTLRVAENRGVALGGLGEYSPTSPYQPYYMTMMATVNARFIFLLATVDYLTVHRASPQPWHVVWRYLVRFATLEFNQRPVNMEGLDGELHTHFDVRVDVQDRGDPRMMGLARKYFERAILDDIVSTLGAGDMGTGGSVPSKPRASPSGGCNLCGKTGCSYTALTNPPYICQNKISVQCELCAAAGYPKLYHARSGPRKEKTCLEYRKEVDAKK